MSIQISITSSSTATSMVKVATWDPIKRVDIQNDNFYTRFVGNTLTTSIITTTLDPVTSITTASISVTTDNNSTSDSEPGIELLPFNFLAFVISISFMVILTRKRFVSQ